VRAGKQVDVAATKERKKAWRPSLARQERDQIQLLKVLIDCANGTRARADFDKELLGRVIAGTTGVPSPEQWKAFTLELDRGLRLIATPGEAWEFTSPALNLAIDNTGRPQYEDYSGIAWRYRAAELILHRQAWRVGVCPWDKTLFAKTGRSKYCKPACARAAERDLVKKKLAAASAPVAPGFALPQTGLAWAALIDADLIGHYLAECPDHRDLDAHEHHEFRHVITDTKGTKACVKRGLVRYGKIESQFPASALQTQIDVLVLRAAAEEKAS
jgi:hypothetical protein